MGACSNSENSSQTNTVDTQPPEIIQFSTSDNIISDGSSTQLFIAYRNGSGSIDNGVGEVVSGLWITVSPTTTTTYTLTVEKPGFDSLTASLQIEVVPPPVIVGFNSDTDKIVPGSSISFTPVFSGGVGKVSVGIGEVQSGSVISVAPRVTTTYTLSVENTAGDIVKKRKTFYSPLQISKGRGLNATVNCLNYNGTAQCWGANNYYLPVSFLVTPTPDQITVTGGNSCTLTAGAFRCEGIVWNPPLVLEDPQQLIANTSCVLDGDHVTCSWNKGPTLENPAQYVSGIAHACTLDDRGVYCWQTNSDPAQDFGQSLVPPLSNPVQVVSGSYHSCALDDNGVICWGANTYGVIDVPPLVNPVQITSLAGYACALDDLGVVCWGGVKAVPQLSNPTMVVANSGDVCAIDDTGLVCWGGANSVAKPPPIANAEFVDITAETACALAAGQVECWGVNVSNNLKVPLLSHATQLSVGDGHVCAIDDSGVVCWGENGVGQADVPLLDKPTAISAGYGDTCAIDASGVVCWGYGGDAVTAPPVMTNPSHLSVGSRVACAIDGNEMLCWGMNGVGRTTFTNPSKVVSDRDIMVIDDSGVHYCSYLIADRLTNTATLDCKSYLNYTNSPGNTYFDLAIEGYPTLEPSKYHGCMIGSSSGVSCFGNNDYDKSTAPTLVNPKSIAVGYDYSCAVDDSGVVCWGYNANAPDVIRYSNVF